MSPLNGMVIYYAQRVEIQLIFHLQISEEGSVPMLVTIHRNCSGQNGDDKKTPLTFIRVKYRRNCQTDHVSSKKIKKYLRVLFPV